MMYKNNIEFMMVYISKNQFLTNLSHCLHAFAGVSGFCLLIVASLMPRIATSAELYAQPSIKLQELYDDNIRLTTAPIDPTFGTLVTPEIDLGFATDTTKVNLNTQFEISRYSRKGLDSDDTFVNLDASHKTERNVLRLDLEYFKDSTLSSEIEESGIVSANTRRRTRFFIHPSWAYDITSETNIKLGTSYTDIQFPSPGTTGLRNSTTYGVDLTLTQRFNPKTDIYVELKGNRYNSVTGLNTEQKFYSVNIGVNHNFSATFTGHVSFGGQKSEVTSQQLVGFVPMVISRNSSATGLLYSVGADKQFELTKLSGLFERTLNPNSLGNLNERDEFKVTVDHDLTPVVSLRLLTRFIQQASTNLSGNNDRDFITVRPEVIWQLTPDLQLVGEYSYRRQKFQTAANAAESNKVMITLQYNARRFSQSR